MWWLAFLALLTDTRLLVRVCIAEWQVEEVSMCPQQKDADCGVFASVFARYVAEHGSLQGFPFTAEDMPQARELIFLELMNGRLSAWR